jgi:predicted methyltransferase
MKNANEEKTDANLKEIIAEMKVWREVLETCQGPGTTEIRTG